MVDELIQLHAEGCKMSPDILNPVSLTLLLHPVIKKGQILYQHFYCP